MGSDKNKKGGIPKSIVMKSNILKKFLKGLQEIEGMNDELERINSAVTNEYGRGS